MSSPTPNKAGLNQSDGPASSLATVWTGGGSSTLNDTIAFFVSWFGSGLSDVTSVTDDAAGGSNAYTRYAPIAFGATGLFGAAYACSGAKAASTITVGFGSSVQYIRTAAGSASGAATSGSINASDSKFTASSTTTANALTSQSGSTATTVDGCLVVGWVNNSSSAGQGGLTGTSPLNFTQWNTQNNPGDADSQLMEYATQTTHGTTAATATSPTAGDGVAVFMLAIAPPGGTSGPPPSQFFLGLSPLAWIIGRRQRLAREQHSQKASGSWRWNKRSRLFLPARCGSDDK